MRKLLFLAFFVLLVGCVQQKQTEQTTTLPTPTQVAQQSFTIEITSAGFQPQRLEIPVGGNVTWLNKDDALQEVSFVDEESGLLGNGESYSRVFPEAGIYRYVSVNEIFYGIIIVKQTQETNS